LSAFNDYMGNLAQLTYQADIARLNRLDAKTLRPLYPDEQSPFAVGTNKVQTLAEHQTNKAQTASPNRDVDGCPDIRAFGDQLIACSEDHEKSKQGDAVTRTHASNQFEVSNQSVDEWLAEYSRHGVYSKPSEYKYGK